jgi:CubicO group peptidase (beta-lactamase class C family)
MAYPGAQVLISLNGEVVYEKAYGYHTYDSLTAVSIDHLYDLASVTKVSSGLPILMRLVDQGVIHLDQTLGSVYPPYRKSNKADMSLREILAHQSGMVPYLVFWQETKKKNGEFKRRTFKDEASGKYIIRVSDSLYMHKRYTRKMNKLIRKSPVDPEKDYRYSGLFFQILPEIIELHTGRKFQDVLQEDIFDPLGIETLTYNPAAHVDVNWIVPTEYDSLFRKQLVHGWVHDEAAAMLGGVSCNAGLFGNARGLFMLFQMYSNGGILDETRIIEEKTLLEFTAHQFCHNENRRGLGFDKPLIDYDASNSYVAKDASPYSFGHSGFTGTFVWADPAYDLIVIFLSNRVHPTRNNRKLYSLNIRPRIHQLAYNMLLKD